MITSGFYKLDETNLLYGPNYVLNLNYELQKENYLTYTYPIDGWYWFDSESDAKLFFGLPQVQNDNIIQNTTPPLI